MGVLRHEDIHLANASGAGNKVVLFGARTGGDGIGGASILASESFEDGMPAKRPSVQVGDPKNIAYPSITAPIRYTAVRKDLTPRCGTHCK